MRRSARQNDKPGYVIEYEILRGDHLSSTAVTGRIKRPTWEADGQPLISLLGLASDGVYTACMLPYSRWSLTPPFHPYPSRLHRRNTCRTLARVGTALSAMGGSFLLHWSGSHLHRTLSGILPFEARTFLTPGALPGAAITCSAYKHVL